MGGMQIPMMGGINGPQMMQQGQMGIPINVGAMGGGQGIPVMAPNGQIMIMQMMPQQLQQLQQSNQSQQGQSQTQSSNPSQNSNPNPSQNNNPQNISNSNLINQQQQQKSANF